VPDHYVLANSRRWGPSLVSSCKQGSKPQLRCRPCLYIVCISRPRRLNVPEEGMGRIVGARLLIGLPFACGCLLRKGCFLHTARRPSMSNQSPGLRMLDRRISGPLTQSLPAYLSSNQNWLEECRYSLSICADRRCSASAQAVWVLVAIRATR